VGGEKRGMRENLQGKKKALARRAWDEI